MNSTDMNDPIEKKPEERKHRRARGSGSVYQQGRVWWIAYHGPDGKRHAESTESERKGDAERLLQRRIGAREHNLPVIPRAEKLTFNDAALQIINDYSANGKKGLKSVQGRVAKHLLPYFGGRRLAGITAAHIVAFVTHRQKQGIVRLKKMPTGDGSERAERTAVRIADVSNAEINRELQVVKRVYSLAIKGGQIAVRPHIPMLRESAPRSGFFDREQIAAVVKQLPKALRPVVEFAYITGWRVHSEVLPLEWRQVDFDAGEVKLDAGTTKNGEARTFPMTADLRTLLTTQDAERQKLKKRGRITRHVFFRMVAKGRGGEQHPKPIVRFDKVWKAACIVAGCPGRIPHDMRRSAVRNLVRAGIPERVAMMLTGHKTRSVFERYNITSPGDLRDAAQKLDDATAPGRRTASLS